MQNTALGAVEAQVGGAGPWRLIGRVARPVLTINEAPDATAPAVVRMSGAGALVGVGAGRAFRVLPDKRGPASRDALTITPASVLASLADVFGGRPTRVSLLVSGRPASVYEGYSPSDGDCILIEALEPGTRRPSDAVDQMAGDYRSAAVAALRERGSKPTTGRLTLSANLQAGLSVAAVTFLLDTVPVALLNRPPYRVVWDTRDWQDGEHMVEVRALDARGGILTRSKALVFVANAN